VLVVVAAVMVVVAIANTTNCPSFPPALEDHPVRILYNYPVLEVNHRSMPLRMELQALLKVILSRV